MCDPRTLTRALSSEVQIADVPLIHGPQSLCNCLRFPPVSLAPILCELLAALAPPPCVPSSGSGQQCRCFGALYRTTTARVVSRTVPAGAAGAVTRTAQTQQSVLSRGRLCSKREIIKCSIIRIIRLIVSDDFCRFLGSRVFEQDGTTSERSRRSRRHCNEKAHFNTLILHTICKLTSYLTSTFRCMLCS